MAIKKDKKEVNQEGITPIEIHSTPHKLIGNQTIIGCGGGLKTDKEYFVSADIATILINKQFAKLKK